MKKTKASTTKRSLILSILSLVLCGAMFLGATFAWFTDSVTSGTNKIVAGNLDIAVSYTKDGNNWYDLAGSDTVFANTLWEPGHTEAIVLKVENKGTLALNYKALVTPVSENGGINVNGNPFKLSDYLVFKTIDKGNTPPEATEYTREAAQAAAGTVRGLNADSLTQTGSLEAGKTAYVILVVYMPTDVGNEANYLTGTPAPTIELGIRVLATQKTFENDGFNDQYDAPAAQESSYVAGAYYDYFEAVNISGVSGGDGKFMIEKTAGATEVLAAASGETENPGDTVTLTVVKSAEAEANFALGVEEGYELNGYDIQVTGQKEGSLVQAKLYVGTGLENFKFYHNGTEMASGTKGALTDGQYFYDTAEGFVYVATTTFSPFQATYLAPLAAIGAASYGSLKDAMAAAKNGETVTLLKDIAQAGGISVASGKNFTVDFNGHTYSTEKPGAGSQGTTTQAFQLLKDSTITFKNGTINCTAENAAFTWESGAAVKGVAMIIQNYANLTLENMVIDGTNIAHNGDNPRYVLSNNSGNVVIKDTKIIALDGDFAFDSCKNGTYAIPTVTVTGNSEIFGTIEMSGGNLIVAGGAFTDLATAITYAADGAVIKLLKDIPAANGISVASGKNFTVDFNGCTYTLNKPGAGSKGTETSGFQLLDNSTIVFKNGTINVSSENLTPATVGKNIKRIIQNYANLTLENMVIDGHNLRKETGVVEEYICSFSGGKVLLTGNTSIIGFAGKVVFDADTYHVGNLTEVTIDTTGKIVGKLEKTDTNGEAKLLVKAGTFSDDPSEYVKAPYEAEENDGLWTVAKRQWIVKSVEKDAEPVTAGRKPPVR